MNRFFAFVGLVFLATACSPAPEAVPTATQMTQAMDLPTASATPEAPPTFTPSPTATPAPTFTPTPSSTPTPTLTPSPPPHPGPEQIEIGHSVQGKPIVATRFGYGPDVILFIGGLHAGFAPATVEIAEMAKVYLTEQLASVPPEVTIYVITNANPDSQPGQGELQGRLNANGVDLNRNWDCRWVQDARFRGEVVPGSGGVEPFSEPETKALVQFVQEVAPVAVVFWEARYEGGFVSPGRCDRHSHVSYLLAQQYGQAADYPVDDFEIDTGQLLNGDGTNWLDAQGYPATAVLLPDYDEVDWEHNLSGILAVVTARP